MRPYYFGTDAEGGGGGGGGLVPVIARCREGREEGLPPSTCVAMLRPHKQFKVV